MSDLPSTASDSTATPPTTTPSISTEGTGPQYEFNEAQNQIINQLAFGMMWVRVPLMVAGLLQVIIATGLTFRLSRDGAHVIGVLGHGMAAVVCFMLASWLQRASLAFMRVTTTEGRDVSHLMAGLKSLALWFDVLAFFVKMYLILLSLLILILLIGLLGGAFRGDVA